MLGVFGRCLGGIREVFGRFSGGFPGGKIEKIKSKININEY